MKRKIDDDRVVIYVSSDDEKEEEQPAPAPPLEEEQPAPPPAPAAAPPPPAPPLEEEVEQPLPLPAPVAAPSPPAPPLSRYIRAKEIFRDLRLRFPDFPTKFSWVAESDKKFLHQLEAILLLPKEAVMLHLVGTVWLMSHGDIYMDTSMIYFVHTMKQPKTYHQWGENFKMWLKQAQSEGFTQMQELGALYDRTVGFAPLMDLGKVLNELRVATVKEIESWWPSSPAIDSTIERRIESSWQEKLVSACIQEIDGHPLPLDITDIVASYSWNPKEEQGLV
jgi:hypothetical protein